MNRAGPADVGDETRALPPSARDDLHPVLAALLARAGTGSRPGHRRDSWRIGLAVEGGAMRGVVSAGMAVGLEALGVRTSFDAAYGSSAGAVNAAYFVAGQSGEAVRFYQDLSRLSPLRALLRVLRGQSPLDLTSALAESLVARHPLNWSAFRESGITLGVLAARVGSFGSPSDCDGAVTTLRDFRDPPDLLNALACSAPVPFVLGGPREFRGGRYLDGGIVERVPVETAIADGCTHVLALVTVPAGRGPRCYLALLERLIVVPRLRRLDPRLAHLVRMRYRRYDELRALLRRRQGNRDGPPYLCAIALPADARGVQPVERRAHVLTSAATAGARAVCDQFGLGTRHDRVGDAGLSR
jgi:predicted patatin/cPLA2 family phospholipase